METPSGEPDVPLTYFFFLTQVPLVNLIETNDFEDVLYDLPNRSQPPNLNQEQQNCKVIRWVIFWKNRGSFDQSPNLSNALRKYRKHFNCVILEEDFLYRLFHDDCGEGMLHQFCVAKNLWREVIFRLHNSKTAACFGISKMVEKSRKRFCSPNLMEILIAIKNCVTCLQLKRVPSKNLKMPVSSPTSCPGEVLQINLVGPVKSPLHRYVFKVIDDFTKHLFAVFLTNVRADATARELKSIFLRHSCLPNAILSDLGSSFCIHHLLLHELTKLLEIQLEQASLKHSQAMGAVECSHSSLKRILKLNTNEQWNDCFK